MLDVRLPTLCGIGATGGPELQIAADRTWKLPGPALTVRALYPPSSLAFLSYSDTLVLLQWESGKMWQLRTIEHMNEDEFVSLSFSKCHTARLLTVRFYRSGLASSRQGSSLHAIYYA